MTTEEKVQRFSELSNAVYVIAQRLNESKGSKCKLGVPGKDEMKRSNALVYWCFWKI